MIFSREDDRDRDAILKNRICDPKVRIAIPAMKSRSRRSDNDLSPTIVIAGRRLRSRRDSEKYYPRSQGQDCDPGDEIAIAAVFYLSRRGDRVRGKDRAIVAKL